MSEGAAAAESRDWLTRVARDRDGAAFSRLYDRYAPLVYGTALRLLSNPAEAQDLLQDVFVYAWENASRFDARRGEAPAWLVTIARSRALDRLRRRAVRREADRPAAADDDAEDLLARLPDGEPPLLELLSDEERRREVLEALAALPAPQREALETAYFGGLTQQEVAEKLGEPLGTVKTRMRLGLMKLFERLAEKGKTP
jgi:RNA polymerase sigma-70 factor (ECF subfamily)